MARLQTNIFFIDMHNTAIGNLIVSISMYHLWLHIEVFGPPLMVFGPSLSIFQELAVILLIILHLDL